MRSLSTSTPSYATGLDLLACLFCLIAVLTGVGTTRDLKWPFDLDHYRDVAQAQTMQDGAWLGDPFYRDETLFYNPLLPVVVSVTASVVDRPVPEVFTRIGAFLNALAPAAFYVMAVSFVGRQAALAALVAFLFVGTDPSFRSPTYTPWLFPSSFAQAWFYLSLWLYGRVAFSGRLRPAAAIGACLGLAFLTHAAPAILLGAVFVTATAWQAIRRRTPTRTLGWELGTILCGAFVVSLPFSASILGRYHLRVVNGSPLWFLDPATVETGWWSLVSAGGSSWLLGTLAALGAVALIFRRTPALGDRHTVLLVAWIATAAALFWYTGYVWHALSQRLIDAPLLLPAHHFALYLRAAYVVCFGCGVVLLARLVGRVIASLTGRRTDAPESGEPFARGAFVLLVTILVATALPTYFDREDFNDQRARALAALAAPDYARIIPWLRAHSSPTDVFLSTEADAESIIGPAGRKVVVVGALPRHTSRDATRHRVTR